MTISIIHMIVDSIKNNLGKLGLSLASRIILKLQKNKVSPIIIAKISKPPSLPKPKLKRINRASGICNKNEKALVKNRFNSSLCSVLSIF